MTIFNIFDTGIKLLLILTVVFWLIFFWFCFVWSRMKYNKRRINLFSAISVSSLYGFLFFMTGSLFLFLISLLWETGRYLPKTLKFFIP